jgi:hypothetical protein
MDHTVLVLNLNYFRYQTITIDNIDRTKIIEINKIFVDFICLNTCAETLHLIGTELPFYKKKFDDAWQYLHPF